MAEGGNRGRVVGNYVLEKQIGSGSFSVVWRARHIHRRGYEVAIKEIVTHKLSQKLRDSLFSETNILRDIKHPNIIRLHDIVEDSGRTFIVLEYCTGGDLAAYIQRCGRFSEAVARHIMIQLAAGLKVLRENNLIHRDLKPQNLLLSTNDANAVLKIADFGFARSLQPQGLAETLCGSPLYMAPEIMQSRKYDAKADLWSVGTILFQLVTGNPPFSGNSQIQLMENIMSSNKLQFPHDVVGDLHPDCIDLCQKLLRQNPVERLSFEEFFNHRFMIQTRPTGVYGNTSMGSGDSTVVETADASQDDCLPLTLDKEPESHSSSLLPTNNTSSISYSSSHLDTNTLAKRNISNKNFNLPGGKETPSDNIDSDTSMQFSTSKYKHQRSFESAPQKALTFEDEQAANVEQQLVDTTSPKVVDSLECIEQEYVLVNAHAASTETSCSSLGASGLDYSQSKSVVSPSKKIQKSTCAPMQIVGAAVGSTCGVESLESQSSIPLGTSGVLVISRDVLDRPSDHPPTRLETLQRCAHLITELAKEKHEAGQQLETFSIQLVCLAIWKQALRVSHTWAASFTESSPCEGLVHSRDMHDEGDFQMAAAACSQLKQEFLRAVESAEQLANCLGPLDGNAEMPDAMEILFQTALALGRKGAMNELFEAKDNAAALYLKSVTLLSFILVEASSLELNPPFSLSTSDRNRLRQYIDCLAHQNQCIAHSRVFVQSEDQQSL